MDQVERIHHLEQALDQCQVYINELKLQLMNQQFLKDQLAATEEISHIQQQAITALRSQLADQQALAAQVVEATQQQTVLSVALTEAQAAVEDRQAALEQLQSQLQQEQVEAQAFQADLAQQILRLQALLDQQQAQAERQAPVQRTTLTSQLATAQEKVAALQSSLSDRQAAVVDLETQLQRTQVALAAQQDVFTALRAQAPEEKNQVIQGLSKKLLSAHTKIEALETEFSSQLMLQAKLQHSCQELEVQRDFYRERITQLEQQVAEMQEQILKQAQQASEYEAAVQHWKDQCLSAEHSVLQLKAVLEQILKERNPELVTAAPNPDSEAGEADSSSGESEPASFLKALKLDLPSFLHLRRHSKS